MADSDDDTDVEEIAVIPAKGTRMTTEPANLAKRRKSSPQMDPIPTYTPTPLHILERRKSATSAKSSHGRNEYNPMLISNLRDTSDEEEEEEGEEVHSSPHSSARSSSRSMEYTPLLEPSPNVVGRTTVFVPETHDRSSPAKSKQIPPQSASACRPVSGPLVQAVARRRNSLQQPDKQTSSPVVTNSNAARSVTALVNPALPVNSDEPVMWSPQLPSQIQAVSTNQPDVLENGETYTLPRPIKQRIAHKSTVPKNKQNRPRAPIGVAKKVPMVVRHKYLNVIIDEYLNTGHPEQESYDEALKEEKAIALRAANKSIYINLVAGIKKKIREKAGVSTLPPDDDPKYVNGNKVVSHHEILTGKVKGTFSIEKKRKSSDPGQLSECELYDRLLRYVLPLEELEDYGYPCRDPDFPDLRKASPGKDGQKQTLRSEFANSYTCDRCAKVYRVDNSGLQLPTTGKCIYHPGHLWNERINKALEKRYSCCKGDPSAGGCSSNPYHVHRGEMERANYLGYVETQDKPEHDPNKHGIYALDCEMCFTTYGLELTRVTIIDHKSDVVYERLVKPNNPILDYNTKFSGIKEGDLDTVTTTLSDIQTDLLNMFSSKTILVGHSLDSDMKALKLFHKRFIDTAQLFPHKRGLPFKRALRTLMVENLRVIIQEDAGHDSKEDATAAFRLVMWKAKTDVPAKSAQ